MNAVIYQLTPSGKTPSKIIDGGYFPKANNNDSPQDFDFIGISNSTTNKINSKQKLIEYLNEFTKDWISYSDVTTNKGIKFNQITEANNFWSKLNG